MEYTIHESENYLVHHRLGPGDRIPTERRLSEIFGVSRAVVRDALKTLAALWIIEVRERVGTFVASVGTAKLASELSRRLFVKRESIESLLAMRHTLERSTAGWAALKYDVAGRERLAEILGENISAAATGDIHGFRRSDFQLHIAIAEIAEIAQNGIVLGLLHEVFKYLRSFGALVEGYDTFISLCSDEHKQIVDAIHQNDVVASREAVVSHLGSVHAHLLERIE